MKNPFAPITWKLAHDCELVIGNKAVLMGILNVTPDSFSDGGKFETVRAAVEQANRMIDEGAVIIDIGGESTRPGAEAITAEEEQSRVVPVIRALSGLKGVFLSIDTYNATTAHIALEEGAHIVNDVWGFQKDPDIAAVAAKFRAGCCAMHTGRERNKKKDVVEDQKVFLEQSVKTMRSAGIGDDSIVLDPGFGFAKDPDENIALLSRFEELHGLGFPLLVGTSRKRFIGHVTGREEGDRDIGTSATSVVARMKGAAIFRVHDVATNADALAIADSVLGNTLLEG